MTPDPYTQPAYHLHGLGMGYPLKDDLVNILRANFSPAEAEVAMALPNTRIPLEVATADEVAADLGRPVEEVADVLEGLARRGLLFSGATDEEACVGCGVCNEACPVDALAMGHEFPTVHEEVCIGWGLCALPCPSDAVRLKRRADVAPPATFAELYGRILEEKRL